MGAMDTGAFYTNLPRPLVVSLGIVPHKRERFMRADGRIVESDVGHMWVRVGSEPPARPSALATALSVYMRGGL